MLNTYSYIFRNHHYYSRDNSYTFIARCIQTKLEAGISKNYAFSICQQEYKFKKQQKDIKK